MWPPLFSPSYAPLFHWTNWFWESYTSTVSSLSLGTYSIQGYIIQLGLHFPAKDRFLTSVIQSLDWPLLAYAISGQQVPVSLHSFRWWDCHVKEFMHLPSIHSLTWMIYWCCWTLSYLSDYHSVVFCWTLHLHLIPQQVHQITCQSGTFSYSSHQRDPYKFYDLCTIFINVVCVLICITTHSMVFWYSLCQF